MLSDFILYLMLSGIRAVVRFDRGAGVDLGNGSTIGCWNPHLDGKCWISIVEWLSSTSAMYESYVWEEC
jgi:hypothetical protein